MKRAFAGLILFAPLLLTPILFGQPNPPVRNLEFEVASIRPADPIVAGSGTAPNIGIHVDGAQFRASSMALRDYLMMAYQAKQYQIEGPEWITTERFDINAKMPVLPEGRTFTPESFAVMVRSLVEDRFEIKTHRTQKEFAVYALVAAKGGIKATVNELDALDGRGVTAGGTGNAEGTLVSLGRGATLAVGDNKLEAKKFNMTMLADTLARFVDRPVVDQTGLTSAYDISLELTPDDFRALMIRAAIAAGATLPPQALKLAEAASGDSLHAALEKVGLKLENKKVPLEVIVVDSLKRQPSEN